MKNCCLRTHSLDIAFLPYHYTTQQKKEAKLYMYSGRATLETKLSMRYVETPQARNGMILGTVSKPQRRAVLKNPPFSGKKNKRSYFSCVAIGIFAFIFHQSYEIGRK